MNEIDYDATIKQLLSEVLKQEPKDMQLMAATIEHLERARQVRLFGSMAALHQQVQFGRQHPA